MREGEKREGGKEKHRLKQNAKLHHRTVGIALEATYFPNANNSGGCGDVELESVKVCGQSMWSFKRQTQRVKLVEIETGYAVVHITGCAGMCD